MDFRVSDRVKSLLERGRAFVRAEVLPLEPRFLLGQLAELAPALEEARRRGRAAGLWAPHLPEELGGLGLSLLEFAHVSEELGRTPLGHYALNCQAPDIGNMEILHRHGTPEQQRRFLAPLAAGEVRS